uniref:Calicivirus coat protein domain-containing protein n=1 Tax=Picornavirales sp. TaxID=1955153 RepID=A0A6M3YPT6_9VIRU|nr:MAG: hypothetical protein 2 [Picornavirales sp.]
MSNQEHIPQPNASAESPGEQIQSTDTALPMTSIEISQPSFSQELTPAVGEMNQLDPWFYTQFRQIDTLTWTTSDEPGKLLWYVALNPLSMDKNLAYLARLYLAWAGDFNFNFKVAGTGFHAGLLTFVKTPPTIHPTRVTNPEDFSIMPWDAVDPKMLEVGSMYGRDIRPIKYHYVEQQPNAPPDYAIGGYLALFVNLPLATSSSGVPRINIAIWVKNAPNFRFGWMLPYTIQDNLPSIVPPDGLNWILDFSKHIPQYSLASCPITPTVLTALPADTKVLNTGVYNCYNIDGEAMSMYDADKELPLNTGWTGFTVYSISAEDKTMTLNNPTPFWFYEPTVPLPIWNVSVASEKNVLMSDSFTQQQKEYLKINFKEDPSSVFKEGDKVNIGTINQGGKMGDWVDTEYAPPATNESFLVFGDKAVFSAQTEAIMRFFRAKNLSTWLPTGQVALFQIYETEQDLPIGYAKLYRQGFFTTRAWKEETHFMLDKMKFKFISFALPTSTIPQTPEMSQSRMLVSYYHGKALKAASKKSSASRKHNTNGSSSTSSGCRFVVSNSRSFTRGR